MFRNYKELNILFSDSNEMFRRLVENLRVGVYIADQDGNLIYVNHAFAEILGFKTKDEVVGLNLSRDIYVDPSERNHFLKQLAKTGFVRDYEVKNKKKDGQVIILSVTSNFIRNSSDTVIGVEGVIHDITDFKNLENAHNTLAMAVEQTADNVMITDKSGTICYVNPTFEITTGYSHKEALGKNPRILKSGKHDHHYYTSLWTTILSGKVFSAQTTNKRKNGELFVADQIVSPMVNSKGEITHFVSVWRDVTEKIRLEHELRTEKSKLEEILGFDEKVSSIRKFDALIDFVVEKTSRILQVKKCVLMLLDEISQELCIQGSKGIDEKVIREVRIPLDDSVWVVDLKDGRPLLSEKLKKFEQINNNLNFSFLGERFLIVPIRLDNKLLGALCVGEKYTDDINPGIFEEMDIKIVSSIVREVAVAIENVKLYKELNYLAVMDSLTQIYNYRYFNQSLDYELKMFNRFALPLTLMMIDVDDFKSYNDSFGHIEGDILLTTIAKVIHENIHDTDILCRYAGDEFVIICPMTNREGGERAAERIISLVEKIEAKRKVSISIGLANYSKGMSRMEFTSMADKALYKAKKEGKNKACYF